MDEKFLKTSHAVRNFFSILIRSTLVKQAENDKKTEKIKAKIAEGFISVCLTTFNAGIIRKKS